MAALVLGVSSLAAHQDKLQDLADDMMGEPLTPTLEQRSTPGTSTPGSFSSQRGVPAGLPAYRPAAAPKGD